MTQEQGLGLYDISGFGEDVPIGGDPPQKIRVKGISAKGILILLMRYPDMQRWLSGQSIAIPDVMMQTPDAIAAIIAAGTGNPGEGDAEDIASNLPIEIQTDIVEAIYRQTFRSGFGPFVNRVLTLYANAVASGLPGKVPDTKSPPESQPSLEPDTAKNEPGTTLPVK